VHTEADPNFVKELRDEAMRTVDEALRKRLREQADTIDYVVKLFTGKPTSLNLSHVVGAFAAGWRLLRIVRDSTPPTGNGGAMRVEEQERKVA
jgi:hypothetical protein